MRITPFTYGLRTHQLGRDSLLVVLHLYQKQGGSARWEKRVGKIRTTSDTSTQYIGTRGSHRTGGTWSNTHSFRDASDARPPAIYIEGQREVQCISFNQLQLKVITTLILSDWKAKKDNGKDPGYHRYVRYRSRLGVHGGRRSSGGRKIVRRQREGLREVLLQLQGTIMDRLLRRRILQLQISVRFNVANVKAVWLIENKTQTRLQPRWRSSLLDIICKLVSETHLLAIRSVWLASDHIFTRLSV